MSRRRRGGRGYAYPADVQRNPQAGTQPAAGAGIVRGQAMDLGDFGGEAVEPVLATFTWFGRRFRVNPDLTETTLIDLFDAAAKIQVDGAVPDPSRMSTEELAAASRRAVADAEQSKNYVREHIHPDDFDDLWATAKANRQGMQALLELCWRIIELVSERPTSPPSGSSGGRPDISRSLPHGASPPAAPDAPGAASWWPEGLPYNPTAAKFVEQFEQDGRPDKANIVMLAQEARARAAVSAGRTG